MFSHDTAGGLFANLEDAKKKNIDDEDSLLFSILYNLESMRNDNGVFHFKLCHPELTEVFPCNEWIQSSNPVTESKISDFSAINLTYLSNGNGESFGGLAHSPSNIKNNLMDDTPEDGNWWNSIGTLTWFGSEIPGPSPHSVKKKELYVNMVAAITGQPGQY